MDERTARVFDPGGRPIVGPAYAAGVPVTAGAFAEAGAHDPAVVGAADRDGKRR